MDAFNCKLIEQKLVESSIDLSKLRAKCDKLKLKLIKNRKDVGIISEVVPQFINDLKQKYVKCASPNDTLNTSIECYITSLLHNTIVSVLYDAFKEEDELIFRKCLTLQHVKFSHNFGDIRFPAAIVELASLDAHGTVQAKIACITACFDFIYAELKYAMVELIVENGGECEEIPGNIPIVNDSDVVHLLVETILRAKCRHLYSNLYYIQSLSNAHLEDKNCEHVILCFNDAIEKLTQINEDVASSFRKTCSEMDLKQYDNLVRRLENSSINNSYERLSMRRVTKQITKSHEYIGNL